jgi:hypothetical protein
MITFSEFISLDELTLKQIQRVNLSIPVRIKRQKIKQKLSMHPRRKVALAPKPSYTKNRQFNRAELDPVLKKTVEKTKPFKSSDNNIYSAPKHK